MRRIVLIAGNHHQIQDYIRQSGRPPRDFVCVHERSDIAGLHAEQVEAVIRTGTHWENPMSGDVSVRYLEQELERRSTTRTRRG